MLLEQLFIGPRSSPGGSVWAETLSKRRPEAQDHFPSPPGPQNPIKMTPARDPKQRFRPSQGGRAWAWAAQGQGLGRAWAWDLGPGPLEAKILFFNRFHRFLYCSSSRATFLLCVFDSQRHQVL